MNNGDIKLVIDQLHGMELDPDTDEVIIFNSVNLLETLGNKIAEQAALIEKLQKWVKDSPHRIYCMRLDIHDERDHGCTCGKEALAIPTDSKQVLTDWMREQLGEPVAWCHIEDGDTFVDGLQYFKDGYSDKPLFKLPECLK